MKRPLLLTVIAIAAATNINAQTIGTSTLNSASGTVVIGANEFDWSVGEMTMVKTDTAIGATSIIVTQGLLQPATFTEGVPTNSLLAKQLQVFPNPATSVVNIDYTSPATGTLTYRLMDIAGKEITNKTVAVALGKTTEQVNVSNLANATYMLEITVNSGSSPSGSISYKIEKRN